MNARKDRVLVAGELRDFIDRVDVPPDVELVWLEPDEPIPGGDFAGMLPLLTRRVDARALDRLPDLRVIANYAVGYDNVDLDAARERGVAVSNTPEVLTEATADLCWALILATCRRLGEAERLVRRGSWHGWHPTLLLGHQLWGKRLGLLGAGRIGQAVGRRAIGFSLDVVYWSRSRQPDWETEVGARRIEELDQLLSTSDIVSLHLPLTEETRRIIDAERLRRMKPGAVLVNTARGGLVDEPALCDALESGRLWGAGLDVYADEPNVDGRLLELENVVLLPHIGSATEETRGRMFELAWRNLVRGVRGEPLVTPVLEAGSDSG